jgi:hypothetical protein
LKSGIITVFSNRLAKALKCKKALESGASQDELIRLHAELESAEEMENIGIKLGNQELAGMMVSLISGDPIFSGATGKKNNIPQGNLSWEIPLDTNMVALFAKPYLTLVNHEVRSALSGTARRLQSFFSSHKKPYAVKLRSIEKMLGLNFKEISTLKFNITEHLEALKKLNVITCYNFERSSDGTDWLVRVTRPVVAQND